MKRPLLALATALLGALTTLNAYRPLSNKGYPSVAAVALGVIASELPLQTLATQVGALATQTRRLSPRMRLVAWLVSIASAVGLVGLHRCGHRSQAPLSAALDRGLGSDRRTDSVGLWDRPAPHGATAKAPGIVRMLRIYRDYAHDSDISYGPYGRANHLDIWRRTDLRRDGRAPVLVQVPGGAWVMGNKRGQAHPLMSHLAEMGWICVSINYRLGPRNTWPDHIVDVKQAIAWVKAHIAEYCGDPDFIAVTGGSAGGHLSSLAALTPNDPLFQPGFEDADTRVQAAIPFYGVYDLTGVHARNHPNLVPLLEKSVIKQTLADDPATYRAASPLNYVRADAPPFFVLHGRNDTFLPVEQARAFVARLRAVSMQPVAYAELPFAQHAFDILGSTRAAHAAVAVEQFLAEVSANTPVPLRGNE
ncbi:alpha/beta hydrolase fold domain-containing protein [Mycobacterium sp. pUA109]|uniref:alpha/beta hydrolase fold domain-containing protein n=1 Tax=Mycobacterium sp. pUA109 TaxID=3238982 RepID=UPI00351B8191